MGVISKSQLLEKKEELEIARTLLASVSFPQESKNDGPPGNEGKGASARLHISRMLGVEPHSPKRDLLKS